MSYIADQTVILVQAIAEIVISAYTLYHVGQVIYRCGGSYVAADELERIDNNIARNYLFDEP